MRLKGVTTRGAAEDAAVEGAKRGDAKAAAALFHEHWEYVWRVAYGVVGRREDADEVAQDAFVAAFSNLHGFEGRSSFRTWITRIAINKGLNVLRREKNLSRRWPDIDIPASSADERPASELLDALSDLSADRRTVVVLRYWLGCSIDEVSDLLDLPAGTVNSRLARGLRELRAALEVNCVG